MGAVPFGAVPMIRIRRFWGLYMRTPCLPRSSESAIPMVEYPGRDAEDSFYTTRFRVQCFG